MANPTALVPPLVELAAPAASTAAPRAPGARLAVIAVTAAALAVVAGRVLGPPGPAIVAAAAAVVGGALGARRRAVPRGGGAHELAAELAPTVDQVMIGAAETQSFVAAVARQLAHDGAEVDTLRARIAELATTTDTVATRAGEAARVAGELTSTSAAGRDQIAASAAQMGDARRDSAALIASTAVLADHASRVHGVIRTIETLASRTRLLALNASIEAALAGQHGKGFAVVASEIRGLAQQTRAATVDIGATLRELREGTIGAQASIVALAATIDSAADGGARVDAMLRDIAAAAERSGAQSRDIAFAAEALAGATREAATAIDELRASSARTEGALPRARDSAARVAALGEALYDQLARHHIGGRHAEIRQVAESAAAAVARLFEDALARGHLTEDALFDRRHVPIPGTAPPKYHTRFDDFTDRALPAIQEPILTADPGIAYAIVTDDRGYVPTHNTRFAAEPTGDAAVDLAKSRSKRIFDDPTGRRCGTNRRPYLLQTYQRDTGEVMHDLSVPIVVRGRHWGGFRIGYRSATTGG